MPNEQLVAYIKSQLAAGVSKEDISRALVTSGWQVPDINTAFSAIGTTISSVQVPNQAVSPSVATKKRSMWPAIIVTVVLVLIFGGAASAAYYTFFAQPAQAPVTVATSTTPVSAMASSTVPSTQNPTAGPTVCTDMSCLAAAAREQCSPASLNEATTTDFDLGTVAFTWSIKEKLAVKGLNSSADCIFSDETISNDFTVTPQQEQKMEAQGMTKAQIQQQLQASNASAANTDGIMTCSFTTTRLTQILTDWSQGTTNSSDFNSSNCTDVGVNGNAIQLEPPN